MDKNREFSKGKQAVIVSSLVTSVLVAIRDLFRDEDAGSAVMAICALDILIQAIVLAEKVVLMGTDGRVLKNRLFSKVEAGKLDDVIIFCPASSLDNAPADLTSNVPSATRMSFLFRCF